MKKSIFFLFFLLIGNFIFFLKADVGLEKDILETIYNSVFEVVLEKLSDGNLKYATPLPYDSLPFAERNDRYISIGTAFAVSDKTFLSAAHVFFLENETQFSKIFIRDRAGNVYEIEDIVKYSNYKDYVLFTVKDKNVNKVLNINYNPDINQKVYAVGNALGEGVIIRDGLLTSMTLEKEKGEWQWLRFSAAASPGNSGGPLLDSKGRIVGIITMKSPNENLNYALPIKEILKDTNFLAVYNSKFSYSVPNMNRKTEATFNYKTLVPKNYLVLKGEIVKNFSKFCFEILGKLIRENNSSMFPNGKNSLDLLFNTINAIFPHIIAEGEDGKWDAYYPKEIKKGDLIDKGFVQYGSMMGIDILFIRKPDSYSLVDIVKDSEKYMDTVLKGVPFNRKFLNSNIRITSLGKAFEESEYIDNYKRKWIIRTWLLPYMDAKLLSFSLVVPSGVISLIKIDQTGAVNSSHIIDMKFLTDYVYLTYTGTFREWTDFYKDFFEYIPDSIKNLEFSYQDGKSFSLKTDDITLKYSNTFLNFNDNSYIQLNMTYYKELDQVKWGIGGIVFGESYESPNFVSFIKKIKPIEGVNESVISDWEKIINRKNPYNQSVQYYQGNSYIYTVHSKNIKKVSEVDSIYFSILGMEGIVSSSKFKKKIKELEGGFKVNIN